MLLYGLVALSITYRCDAIEVIWQAGALLSSALDRSNSILILGSQRKMELTGEIDLSQMGQGDKFGRNERPKRRGRALDGMAQT